MNEKSYKLIVDEKSLNLLRYIDLKDWGYIGSDELKKRALWYLIQLGRNAELSSLCEKIMHESRGPKEGSISWKMKMLYAVYRLSPRIFDSIAYLSGKRITEQNALIQ